MESYEWLNDYYGRMQKEVLQEPRAKEQTYETYGGGEQVYYASEAD